MLGCAAQDLSPASAAARGRTRDVKEVAPPASYSDTSRTAAEAVRAKGGAAPRTAAEATSGKAAKAREASRVADVARAADVARTGRLVEMAGKALGETGKASVLAAEPTGPLKHPGGE